MPLINYNDLTSPRIVPIEVITISMVGGTSYALYYPEKGSTWAVNELTQGPTPLGMEEPQAYEVTASLRFAYNRFDDMRSMLADLDSRTVDTITIELAALAGQQKGAQMAINLSDTTAHHRSQAVRFRMGSTEQLGAYLEITVQAYLSADIWNVTGSHRLFQQVIGWS